MTLGGGNNICTLILCPSEAPSQAHSYCDKFLSAIPAHLLLIRTITNQEEVPMSKRNNTAGRRFKHPTRMIPVLLLTLLIPLTGYTDDLNEDMIKAAYKGDIATVKALLAKGAEVNAKLKDSGWTALMLAASEGHTEIVRFLLSKGADVNAKCALKDTSLIRAAREGHTDTVQALLANGAEVNAKGEFGLTALMVAAHQGAINTVKVLIANGADVNAKGDLGDTALSRAIDMSNTDIIRILKEAGAKE